MSLVADRADLRYLAVSCLLFAALCSPSRAVGIPSNQHESLNAELQEETSFFLSHDSNRDGQLSKKEFYYAIMDDAFENIAARYDISAVDMEFEAQDLDGDKKVSLNEWRGIFTAILALRTTDEEHIQKAVEEEILAAADEDIFANDISAEEEFFLSKDDDMDGMLSKKEFYVAVMEDKFSKMTEKMEFGPEDMDFDIADVDGDGRISLHEWNLIFFHDTPQTPQYVDGEPAAPPVQEDTSSSVSAPGGMNMAVEEEIILKSGRKVWLASQATWFQARTFCDKHGASLCEYDHVCPHIKDELSEKVAEGRWAPIFEHHMHRWVSLNDCGVTMWADTMEHLGMLTCCGGDDKDNVTTFTDNATDPAPEAQNASDAATEKSADVKNATASGEAVPKPLMEEPAEGDSASADASKLRDEDAGVKADKNATTNSTKKAKKDKSAKKEKSKKDGSTNATKTETGESAKTDKPASVKTDETDAAGTTAKARTKSSKSDKEETSESSSSTTKTMGTDTSVDSGKASQSERTSGPKAEKTQTSTAAKGTDKDAGETAKSGKKSAKADKTETGTPNSTDAGSGKATKSKKKSSKADKAETRTAKETSSGAGTSTKSEKQSMKPVDAHKKDSQAYNMDKVPDLFKKGMV